MPEESYMEWVQRKKDEYFEHCLRLCREVAALKEQLNSNDRWRDWFGEELDKIRVD